MKHFLVFILFVTLILGSCTPPKEITGLTVTTMPALIPTVTATKTPSPVPTQTTTPDAPVVETPTLKPETPTPIPAYSSEQLSQMTDAEKANILNAAPATIGDLTKDNFSTIKNNLIIYRDSAGSAMLVFDLSINETSPLLDAGIIEFNLADGSKLEMIAFVPDIPQGAGSEEIEAAKIKTLEEMVEHMVEGGVLWGDLKMQKSDEASSEDKDFFSRLKKLPDVENVGAFQAPSDLEVSENDRFLIIHASIKYQGNDSTLAIYRTDEGIYSAVFILLPIEEFKELFRGNKVPFPPKP